MSLLEVALADGTSVVVDWGLGQSQTPSSSRFLV